MLREKLLAVMQEINTMVVAEREQLVELISVALLTHNNLFILGDTGQAKSYAINAFRSRITGARQFERLLSKQCDEEQLFGRLDLGSLIPGGVSQAVLEYDSHYQSLISELTELQSDMSDSIKIEQKISEISLYRKVLAELNEGSPSIITKGKIPESEICFLDEIFKANDGILNALLTALNERKYTNEGRTVPIPTISFFAASNEIPNFSDPSEAILRPLYDRFNLKIVTQYVQDRGTRLKVLQQKQKKQTAQPTQYISFDELLEMQKEVERVDVPYAIYELWDDVLCELRRKNIHVSDRKFFGFAPIVMAKAWLDGRAEVEPKDLLILENYLWTRPEELTEIRQVLEKKCLNPLKDEMEKVYYLGQEAFSDFMLNMDIDRKKALIKFKKEIVTVYGMAKLLEEKVDDGSVSVEYESLIAKLTEMNKTAHEQSGFTPVPLEELATLQ